MLKMMRSINIKIDTGESNLNDLSFKLATLLNMWINEKTTSKKEAINKRTNRITNAFTSLLK